MLSDGTTYGGGAYSLANYIVVVSPLTAAWPSVGEPVLWALVMGDKSGVILVLFFRVLFLFLLFLRLCNVIVIL